MLNKLSPRGQGGSTGGGGGAVDEDTLTTTEIAKGIYMISEGPIEGLYTGDANSIYLNDVAIADSAGVSAFEGVEWEFRNGLPDQTYIPGFPAAVSYANYDLEVKKLEPRTVTIANGSQEYDAALIVIQIPELWIKTDSGNYRTTRLAYHIDVRGSTGSWVRAHTVDMLAKATTTQELIYRVDLPTGFTNWEVRVTRDSDDSWAVENEDGSLVHNQTILARYGLVTDGKFSYRNTAVLGFTYQAKLFGTTIPTVRVKVKGLKVWVPKNYDPITRVYATSGAGTSSGVWDGTFKFAWTNNPAWIYYDLLINNRYGLGQDFNPNDDPDSAFVDKYSLYNIAQYCDGLVDDGFGGTEPRFTINCQITNKSEAYDLLQNILSTINGMNYFSSDQLYPVLDMPTTVSDAFSQTDVVDGTFEYSGTARKTRHSVCVVRYQDEDSMFKQASVMYEDQEYIADLGYSVVEIDGFGITGRAQALRYAKWVLRTERTQTNSVSFSTGQRGGLLFPGNVIKIFDDYKTGTRQSGRILRNSINDASVLTDYSLSAGTYFILDAPMSVATANTLVYYGTDGLLKSINPIAASTNSVVVKVANGVTEPNEGSIFALITASIDGQQFRILSVTEDKDSGTYNVAALQHDPNKFAYIERGEDLPDNPTSILTSDAISPVTVANVTISLEGVSGSRNQPFAIVSWSPPRFVSTYSVVAYRGQIDYRVTGYEVEFATPTTAFTQVYRGPNTTWTSGVIEASQDALYSVRIRSYDALGRHSPWKLVSDFNVPDSVLAPPPPTNLTLTPTINGIFVNWDNATVSDFKHTEVRVSSTNVYATAPVFANVSDDFCIISPVADDNVRYVFLTTVSHAASNNRSTTYVSGSGTRTTINLEDINPEAISGLTVNADEVLELTLTAAAYRAYLDSLLYLEGVPVGTVVTNFVDEITTSNSAVVSTLSLLGAKNGDDSAFIIDGDTLKLADGTSVVSRLSSLQASSDTYAASINSLETIVDGNVTSLTALSSTVGGHTSSIASLSEIVNGVATTVSSLSTTVGTNTSSISTINSVQTGQAASISTLSSTLGGLTSSVSTLSTAVAGYGARWQLTTDVGGYISGLYLSNTGETSSFKILAANFAIKGPDGNAFTPLVVDTVNNRVIMTDVYVNKLYANSVVTDSLISNALIIPSSASSSSVLEGTAGWLTALTTTITMSNAGFIKCTSVAKQDFYTGTRGWQARLTVNGTQVFYIAGSAVQDSIPMLAGVAVAAGTHTIALQWNADQVRMGDRTLVVEGYLKS